MSTLEKAIEIYGKDMQLNVAIEELSELIKEICKSKRGSDNRDNIIEEMADCCIMLEQLAIIFGVKGLELNAMIGAKISRLENRLAERSEKKSRKELKECLWAIIRAEGIEVTNQNLDWLLERAYKESEGK